MNFRDVEQLSAYLDGQLSLSESARLKTRLGSEPALASTLESLRESRAILRRLPHRRAPRNFLLTPKMVGRKPPLPRSYPVFRFATALATLLFGLSVVTNQVGRMVASAPQVGYGMGGGGGGSDVATEAPALKEPMLAEPASEPHAEESDPSGTMLVMPTPTPEPAAKEAERTMDEQPLLSPWQAALLVAAVLGVLSMFLIQRFAARKWRSR